MELFWKVSAGILISAILCISIRDKDFTILVTLAAISMAGTAIVSFLKPIIDLLWEMSTLAAIQDDILGILLKSAGIVYITDMAGLICRDTGNSSMEKILQMLGFSAVLYLSVPVIRLLLVLIQNVLGD